MERYREAASVILDACRHTVTKRLWTVVNENAKCHCACALSLWAGKLSCAGMSAENRAKALQLPKAAEGLVVPLSAAVVLACFARLLQGSLRVKRPATKSTCGPCHHLLCHIHSCWQASSETNQRGEGQPQQAGCSGEAAEVIFPRAEGKAPSMASQLTTAAAGCSLRR